MLPISLSREFWALVWPIPVLRMESPGTFLFAVWRMVLLFWLSRPPPLVASIIVEWTNMVEYIGCLEMEIFPQINRFTRKTTT
jgi:hypothetical protein